MSLQQQCTSAHRAIFLCCLSAFITNHYCHQAIVSHLTYHFIEEKSFKVLWTPLYNTDENHWWCRLSTLSPHHCIIIHNKDLDYRLLNTIMPCVFIAISHLHHYYWVPHRMLPFDRHVEETLIKVSPMPYSLADMIAIRLLKRHRPFSFWPHNVMPIWTLDPDNMFPRCEGSVTSMRWVT